MPVPDDVANDRGRLDDGLVPDLRDGVVRRNVRIGERPLDVFLAGRGQLSAPVTSVHAAASEAAVRATVRTRKDIPLTD